MIRIFTSELENSSLNTSEISNKISINAIENDSLINHMLNIKKSTNSIEIWDITTGYKTGTIIEVVDHINKTGLNPLFGNQQKLGIDFPDLYNLYLSEVGVITSCYGVCFQELNEKNSSTWISHISIVARAIGIKNISGKLISL